MFKKSQVTVFIIIALVLLVFTGIMYYAISSRAVKRGEEEIVRQQLSAERVEPIKEYVKSCLNLASADGLELLGRQGGYIYKSQGGIVDDPIPAEIGQIYAEYARTIARYGINKPTSDVPFVFYANTPEYPWPTFPKICKPGTAECRITLQGDYGRNNLPPFNKSLKNSIPEQLESFVVNGVIGCIDWTTFTQQGLDITSSEPVVSALFAEADVTFNLKWHLTVKDPGTGAVTDIKEFAVVYPVRMKKILDFIRLITGEDVTNISYNLRASDGYISSYVTEDIFGNDDLITIKDTKSRILDRQYEFRFMRQNRAPALYYISDIGLVCTDSLIEEADNKLTITSGCGGNPVEIIITSVDPDEDLIEITYDKEFPHTITIQDVRWDEFRIKITASDGEYEDWQEIIIPLTD